MNKGRIMYQGAVAVVDEYFGAREHPLPPKYNPADWIMIVAQSVSEEELESQGFFEKNPYPADEASKVALAGHAGEKHVGSLTQLGLLLRRDLLSLKRDKHILGARLMLTGFMAVLMGAIFWQVGKSNSANFTNLNSHFGAEIMVLMSAMMGTALPALIAFPAERPVFIREYSTNHYGIVPYFVARLVMEAMLTALQMILLCVISYFMIGFQLKFGWHFLIVYALAMSSSALAVLLGSLVQDPGVAIELLPMCFIPQLLFAGFFVQPELIPVWLRWLMYVFPLTYATRLHLDQEFSDCAPGQAEANCETLLENVEVNSDDVWWYWLMLLLLFVVLRLGALFALWKKASKFY
mmetsp:Transcript_7178/g.11911  ORF Transcript_7178/g.11911 Transcript_7178/m.11911 type:complete len:351 (-) Transcript_7178:307-1359(-)